ncbi:MAG: hypothetical protein KatS3mg115_1282 [Candidatus Poribacteria bacterium]|nr:MAG: hypothetical protein KatS3mg115_1282 [Candidatus Poribacteria bacterium]
MIRSLRTDWRATVLIPALLFFSVGGRGEEPTAELEAITVTATRVPSTSYDAPNAVTVITREEIERRMPMGVMDALFDEAGVYHQRTTNGQGSPFLRNFTGYHTLMLIDGVRLNNSTFRSGPNQYFNTLDADDAQRIEVVRGPSSVLYGNSAIGGAIHVLSPEPPRFREWTVQPRLFARYASAGGSVAGGVEVTGGNERFGFRALATRKQVGDVTPGKGHDVHVQGRKFFLTSETDPKRIPETFLVNGEEYEWTVLYDVEEPTRYDENAFALGAVWRVDETRQLRVHYQGFVANVSSRWDRIASGEEFSRFEYDPQDRHLVYAKYRAQGLRPSLDRLEATLSYQRQVEGQYQLRVGADPAETTYLWDAIDSVGGSLLLATPIGDRGRLTYGVDAYFDRVTGRQTMPASNRRAWGRFPDGSTGLDVSLYGELEAKPTVSTTLTLGGNLSYYRYRADLTLVDPTFGELDSSGTALTGMVALAQELTEGIKVFASAGTGFRAPNLSDLSGVEVTNQGVQAPSPEVGPERSINLEAGVKLRRGRVGGEIAVFSLWLRDQVVARTTEEVFGDRLPSYIQPIREQYPDLDILVLDNLDESVVRGMEASLSVAPAPWLVVYGVGNFYRGEVLKLNGEPPDPAKPWEARIRREIPPHGTLGVRYLPNGTVWVELFARGAMKQDRLSKGDIRDPRIPGFTRDATKVAFDANGRAQDAGTPGWVTLNLRAGLRLWEQTRLTVAVENLFDRRYRWHGSGVDAPGRNVLISLDQRF